jgi:hypothetical protein
MIKSRWMRFTGFIARTRNTHKVLILNPEGETAWEGKVDT